MFCLYDVSELGSKSKISIRVCTHKMMKPIYKAKQLSLLTKEFWLDKSFGPIPVPTFDFGP